MKDYFDLGTYGREITTTSAEAQRWFNLGLNWSYGFHHEEALLCYKKVVEHDPTCAMGHWGIAYAIGPYYNQVWPEYSEQGLKQGLQQTYTHARQAQKLAEETNATPIEKALINALTIRFPATQVESEEEFSQWDEDYAAAMRDVYAQFAEDYEVSALTAEALMCRTPWQLWDLENRVPAANSSTSEALDIVETAFAQIEAKGDPPHPGLLHFYIHILEMSPEPERALDACDTLLNLVPDCGHLIHMPSHVYVLCGLYEKSFAANAQAGIADQKYVAYNDKLGIYTIYRLHNVHFKIYSALFLGQYERALQAAEEIIDIIPPDGLHHEQQKLVNYLEGYTGMKAHVLVRFGKWQEILDEPLPTDPDLYCVTAAMWQYAKGIAYAVLGDIPNALAQQEKFAAALAKVPEERQTFNNSCRDILGVAEAMLAGELDYRRKNYETAFAHLRESVKRYDQLNYTEPWPWMQPPRHALGALLLEQGHVSKAEAVYRADLGLDDTLVRPSQHPDNVWSLHGYAECLERLGRHEETAFFQEKLATMSQQADIPITASCFCRKTNHCCD
ncbi:MAG: hypothetical protein AAF614_18465 [Chloroflexota bacterium]